LVVLAGQFEHQFNDVGTFYYTTGYIGQKENIEMRGQVTVEARNAFVADVTVTRGGQTAAMNSGSGTSCLDLTLVWLWINLICFTFP